MNSIKIIGIKLFFFIVLILVFISCQRGMGLAKIMKDGDLGLTEVLITDVVIDIGIKNYIIVDYEFVHDGKTIQLKKRIKKNKNLYFYATQFPKGSRLTLVYDRYLPKKTDCHKFVLYKAVHDSLQVFSKTTAKIEKLSFYQKKDNVFYGGIHLFYSYTVNDTLYYGHDGIELVKNFKRTNFKESVIIEYDVNNPSISRFVDLING